MDRLRAIVLVGIVALLAAIIVPVLAAKPGDSEKAAKGPITLTGTVQLAADSKGRPAYTLTSGLTTYTLKAGPRKLTGASSPLNQYVGQSVTITGALAGGNNQVNVLSINGTALHGNGRPAWAGGWKAAGAGRPGRSQADCFPPGQCKDKANRGNDENGDEADESEPPEASEASEAPEAPAASQAP